MYAVVSVQKRCCMRPSRRRIHLSWRAMGFPQFQQRRAIAPACDRRQVGQRGTRGSLGICSPQYHILIHSTGQLQRTSGLLHSQHQAVRLASWASCRRWARARLRSRRAAWARTFCTHFLDIVPSDAAWSLPEALASILEGYVIRYRHLSPYLLRLTR